MKHRNENSCHLPLHITVFEYGKRHCKISSPPTRMAGFYRDLRAIFNSLKITFIHSFVLCRDILRYATARHIEVIPEIDMPAHSHAAIKAMEARYRRLLALNVTEASRYSALLFVLNGCLYSLFRKLPWL